jgi:PAS domain S-box-containing protein
MKRFSNLARVSIKDALLAGAAVVVAGQWARRRLAPAGRQAARALRESEERFRRLTEHSPVGVYQLAPNRAVIYLNRAARAMLELGDDETPPAEEFERFFAPATIESMKTEHAKRERGIASTYEVEMIGARGGRRSVLVSGAPLFDPRGTLQSLIGTMTDVTERAAAERALRESRRFLSTLISNLPGYAYRRAGDSARTLEFISDGIESLTGYHADDFLLYRRLGLDDLMHPADGPSIRSQIDEALAGRRAWDVTYRLRTRSGEERWVHEQGRGVDAGSGEPEAIEGFVTDITQEKHVQEDLRQSERRLRTIIEHAPEAMLILDVDEGHFVDVNENAVALFGRSRAELLGMDPSGLDPALQPDGAVSVAVFGSHVADALAGRSPVFEWAHRNRQGEDIACEVRLVRLPSGEGRLVRASITDIRERKRLEQQFLQGQKMESIGRLAGGIAHDFNNLMTAVIGYADLALASLRDNEASTDVREIRETAERAASLSQQLLAFSRRQVIEPRVICLNDLIGRTDRILRRLIGADIELVMLPAPDLGLVRVDPNQFEQVLINLAVNARDALANGGNITVETANTELGTDYTQAPAGPYVMLAVSDNGAGMSAEVRERVFEPFYTTKPKGKGTGLGLATCYGVVKQAGGDIWVYSEPGRGSTFKIYLPRVQAADARESPNEENEGEPPRGTETILLVEDDAAVRGVGRRVLNELGYTVLAASGGPEAIELAAACPTPIDLLLTDVVMPKMSGRALAELVASERPEIAVLYTSGYTEEAAVRDGVLRQTINYLAKPYSPRALASKVRAALDANIERDRSQDGTA